MSNQECKSNVCETTTQACSSQEKAECCLPEVPCPVEMAVDKWSGSFMQAMQQTQIDILKDKIRKAWGPMMDKVADEIVQAMGTRWQAMLTQAKSQCDLRENIKKIYQSVSK